MCHVALHLGATVPGRAYGPALAVAGETGASASLIVGLFIFIGSRRLRALTPLLFPPLYALMVYLEAPVSGTSTNPARSLGPAVIAGIWHGWWVYWAGPVLGAVIGVALIRRVRQLEVDIAKVYDFEHDRYGLLRWSGEKDPGPYGWPRHPRPGAPGPGARAATAPSLPPASPATWRPSAGGRPQEPPPPERFRSD